MYMTFLGMIADSSGHFVVGKIPEIYFGLAVADILWHVPSKVPDIDFSWHFVVLYLGIVFLAEVSYS